MKSIICVILFRVFRTLHSSPLRLAHVGVDAIAAGIRHLTARIYLLNLLTNCKSWEFNKSEYKILQYFAQLNIAENDETEFTENLAASASNIPYVRKSNYIFSYA